MVMLDGPGDVDLVRTAAGDPYGEPSQGRRTLVILAALLVVALIAAAAFVYLRRGRAAPAAASATQPEQAVKVRQDTEVLTLPPLDQTDALVRQLVSALSSHPLVMAWLSNDRLIDSFVVVTSRVADGQSPARELKSLGPIIPFHARTAQGAVTIDPSSYRRYDRYAQAVAALDARGTARAYETLKPRINESEKNFGGSGTFDPVLERAIVELLKVPVVDGDVALKQAGIGYAFADPGLEAMSPAQKQLFRMGPDNVRAVQGKLREIALALSIPESRLPKP